MAALRYISNPRYGFVIFRRTSPQITNEGGLWDEANKIYPKLKGVGLKGSLEWRFPSGVKGTFRHLQHADTVLDWQGSQIALIGFDELTHFEESQFFYMLSRNRSMSGVRPRIYATTNPAPGWVKRFLSPWLDKSFPNPAASGEVRYFIRVNGEVVWVDGSYRDDEGQGPKSVTFIRSTIYDNKKLLEADPGYLTNLKSLPDVERKRLLEGDWDVFEGAFFDEWSEIKHTITPLYTTSPGYQPPTHWNYFGGLDWGYSSPFAFVLCASDEEKRVHVIESLQMRGLTNEAQADKVRGVLSKWGILPERCIISFDPSMQNRKTINALRGEADIEAFYRAGLVCAPAGNDRQHGWSQVRAFLHNTDSDGKPLLRVWKGHNVDIVEDFPQAVYDTRPTHLEDMDTNGNDHLLDALRYSLESRPRPASAPRSEDKTLQMKIYGPPTSQSQTRKTLGR